MKGVVLKTFELNVNVLLLTPCFCNGFEDSGALGPNQEKSEMKKNMKNCLSNSASKFE